MRSGLGALVAGMIVSCVALAAAIRPVEAEAETVYEPVGPRMEQADERVTAFADYLEAQRQPKAPTADPFAQLTEIGLDGEGLSRAVARAGVKLGEVAAFDLSRIDSSAIGKDDRRCLTQAIYYEARDQSITGKMAVADVVMNRVANSRYPNDVCDVVFQGASRKTGCQFSFTCDGSMRRRIERGAMLEAQTLATAVLSGFRLELTGGATNYHASYVAPYWAPALEKTAVVGDHHFYKRGRKGATATRFALLD